VTDNYNVVVTSDYEFIVYSTTDTTIYICDLTKNSGTPVYLSGDAGLTKVCEIVHISDSRVCIHAEKYENRCFQVFDIRTYKYFAVTQRQCSITRMRFSSVRILDRYIVINFANAVGLYEIKNEFEGGIHPIRADIIVSVHKEVVYFVYDNAFQMYDLKTKVTTELKKFQTFCDAKPLHDCIYITCFEESQEQATFFRSKKLTPQAYFYNYFIFQKAENYNISIVHFVQPVPEHDNTNVLLINKNYFDIKILCIYLLLEPKRIVSLSEDPPPSFCLSTFP
jgi:hypothetical protein